MQVQLLNLISTPVPVLNSLGLDLSVGLSSDDPTVRRRPSESYLAYVTIYSPDGRWMDRVTLGEIPPRRRRMFELSSLTRRFVPSSDHLVVVHRVPASLAAQVRSVDDPLEMDTVPEFAMWRALIQYSYPGKGNGSVIYETPPRLNVRKAGAPPSTTLTFTSKIVLSPRVNTYVVPIHYSMDPGYSATCNYHYVVLNGAGAQVVKQSLNMSPFSVATIDIGSELTSPVIREQADPEDGIANFSFVAYSDDAALAPLILNLAPGLGGVSVEHTHPAQSFLLPFKVQDKNRFKGDAIAAWREILTGMNKEVSRVG